MKKYMGIDIGGTNIKGIIIDEKLKTIALCEVPTQVSQGPEAVCKQMEVLIDTLLDKAKITSKKLSGIGMGIPGVIDRKKRCLKHSGNLHLENIPFVARLEKQYGVNITIENDANVAALGEYVLGAGKGSENMLYVTVSTGIGAGAVLKGEIYHGSTGNALEIGHMVLEQKGPLCNCGNRGCLESLASGTAIGKIGSRVLRKKLTANDVFALAEKKNSQAKKILNTALNYLGMGINNLANIFDPDVIVLGGGVAQNRAMVKATVQEYIRQNGLPVVAKHVKIKNAKLSAKAGMLGAALLALKQD